MNHRRESITPLLFEDVKVGDFSPPLRMGPLTRTHFVVYAGASKDLNPNHHDEVYARANGNPSVFAMGMLPGGYCARVLTDWFGDGSLRRLRFRFVSRAWPGEVITCTGIVKRKYEENGEALVDCEFSAVNPSGSELISGGSTSCLSRRKS